MSVNLEELYDLLQDVEESHIYLECRFCRAAVSEPELDRLSIRIQMALTKLRAELYEKTNSQSKENS